MVVPFYIIFDDDIDIIKSAINKNQLEEELKKIKVYPIKSNETFLFHSKKDQIRVIVMNNNFKNTLFYPLALTNELLVNDNQTILLHQTKCLTGVKIELKKVDSINTSKKENIKEYNI